MTEPQNKTLQYREFLSKINRALPLELTIRAVKLACPEKLEELRDIDAQIRIAWKERGFAEEEVKHNGLAELCWDLRQLGWSERRQPFERYPADLLARVKAGVPLICERYLGQIRLENYPFALRHRYADLVRGMDVGRVLRDYLSKYAKLRSKPSLDVVPLSNFILSFQAPVPVIPGALQMTGLDIPKESEYLGVTLRYDMSLEDVHAALLDFQYHYAEFRLQRHKLNDKDTQRLLDPWGKLSMPTREELVHQAHQIHPKLAGLHCYDLFVAHGAEGTEGSRVRAIKDTIAFHPESIAPDEIRAGKWLDNTRTVVNDLVKELRNSMAQFGS